MRYALALGVAALLLSPCSVSANGIPFRPVPPAQPGGNFGNQPGFQPGIGQGQGPGMVIEVDPKARVARLIVPKKFLNAPVKPRRFGQLPTMMIGTALAMSLAFGGLWLVRKRGVPGVKPLLLAVAILGLGGSVLWADIAPGRPLPQPGPGQFPGFQGKQVLAAFQPIKVETPAQGNVIRLIIPLQQGGVGAPVRPGQPFAPGKRGGLE